MGSVGSELHLGALLPEATTTPTMMSLSFKGINRKRDDILCWVSLSDCAERFRNFTERFRNRSAKFRNRLAKLLSESQRQKWSQSKFQHFLSSDLLHFHFVSRFLTRFVWWLTFVCYICSFQIALVSFFTFSSLICIVYRVFQFSSCFCNFLSALKCPD